MANTVSMDLKKIKNYLKMKIIGKLYLYLRDLYRYPQMLFIEKRLNESYNNCIILLGTPTYNNLGDHLIAISEIDFLKNTFPNKVIIEIPTQVFKRYRKKFLQKIGEDIPIFITGGGWLGSLWPDDEYQMQEMISLFLNNKIIILPQTIYYNLDTIQGKKILASAKETYKSCDNLHLYLRDKASYEFALNYFPIKKNNILLVPDIALYYERKLKIKRKEGILVCLRTDREKIIVCDFKKWTRAYAMRHNMSYKETDTVLLGGIPIWKRKIEVRKIIKKYQSAQIVITDRLHGMIFSVISNTRCIVFDNKTNKVRGVYEQWLKKNPNVLFLPCVVNIAEFNQCLENFCKPYIYTDTWKQILEDEFRKMQFELRKEK